MNEIKKLLSQIDSIIGKDKAPCKLVAIDNTGIEFDGTDLYVISNMKGNDWGMKFEIRTKDDRDISMFHLQDFPKFNHVFLISSNVSVSAKFRNKGIGTIGNKIRQVIAYYCDYKKIVCVVDGCNSQQIKIMVKNNWRMISYGDTSNLYEKDVTDLKKII